MNVLDRFRLDGKRLLITGGSRGFGRAPLALPETGGSDPSEQGLVKKV